MNRAASLAVVEDNLLTLSVFTTALSKLPNLEVHGFSDSEVAMARFGGQVYDLMLVDLQMPGVDGMSLVSATRKLPGYEHVPIVMITANRDPKVRMSAIEAGVTDFLGKPVDPNELRLRAKNLLALRGAQLDLADKVDMLDRQVRATTFRLVRQEEETIWRLAKAIKFRDGGTGEHISRVARVSMAIAREMAMPPETCRMIYLAAALHDVGKVGIRDAILEKPGRLTEEELAEIQTHPQIGLDILDGSESILLQLAAEVAGGHHERWDGSGYPGGLVGEIIPLSARIVAVADVFDALCSSRPYKPGWPLAHARREIAVKSGSHFDPACVAAFMRAWDEIAPIYHEFGHQTAQVGVYRER